MDVDRPPSFTSVAPRTTGSQVSDQLMDTSFSSINQQAPSIGSMLGGRGDSQPTGSWSSNNWPPSYGDVAPRDNSLTATGGRGDSQLANGSSGYNSPPSYGDVAHRDESDTCGGYNIADLVQEAQTRWLKPEEVLFILHNFKETQLTNEPPQKPPSGSLFLFNKRVLRFFHKDGYNWRSEKDGTTVGEAHERLKVGNVEALNCYYAHCDLNSNFERRCYWMLHPGMDQIVLVHYRDITMGEHELED